MARQFVVDNSVVMAWCLEDETSEYVDRVMDSLNDGEAMVPAIWPLEFGNGLLVAERRKRLGQGDSARLLSLINGLPIHVEQESPARMLMEILALARDLRLSSYDASYLDLAMRMGLPIATRDDLLAKAATKCGVPIYEPKVRRNG